MIRAILPTLVLLAACAGPGPTPMGQPPPPASAKAVPAASVPSDPLLAAMALLKAAKEAPNDPAAARTAAAAFLALERDARERGNGPAADRYHQVAADLDPLAAEAGAAESSPPPEGPALDSIVDGAVPPAGPQETAPMDGLRMGTYHFSVRISGGRAARSAEAVVGVLEEAYLRVCAAMAVNPDGKVPVILYTDREFRTGTGLPEWVAGAYDGTIHLPMAGIDVAAPRTRNVIVHEFVHAFNHQVSKGRCPLWLEEGLAQYFEDPRPTVDPRALADAIGRGGLPPLTSPSFLSAGREQATLLYRAALAAVLYLEDRASLAAVSTFLQALGSGVPEGQAFQETFLFPYDRLQGDLLAWLERKSR